MLYVYEKINNKFGIKDTDDDTIEYVTKSQLLNIVRKYQIKINGVGDDGSIRVITLKVSDFKDVIDDITSLMKRSGGGSSIQKDYEEGSVSIRHWGDWVIPSDIDDDEIDDFDWEELAPEWLSKLGEIRKKIETKYKDIKVSIQTNEKNWIDIQIERRGK